jgi:hypothetical protein
MTDPTRLAPSLSFVRPPDTVAKELLNGPQGQDSASLLALATQRAAAMGLDLDAILERDAARLAAFPTRECLTPSEVTAYVADEPLDATRKRHAERCEYCSRILVAAQPTPEQRERFLDELGSLAERARSAGASAESLE